MAKAEKKEVVKKESTWTPPTKHSKKIKVIALTDIFYINHRIRKGSVFMCYEEYFSENNMEIYDKQKIEKEKEDLEVYSPEGFDLDDEDHVPKSVGPKVVGGHAPKGPATGSQKVI